jgi:hypothetical protein
MRQFVMAELLELSEDGGWLHKPLGKVSWVLDSKKDAK